MGTSLMFRMLGERRHGNLCASAQIAQRAGAMMAGMKIIGILLIVAGALGLVYGGFSYPTETHSAKLGPLVLKLQERETVYVPIVASAGAIALGVLLLLLFRSK
jgi:hypothetical protein